MNCKGVEEEEIRRQSHIPAGLKPEWRLPAVL